MKTRLAAVVVMVSVAVAFCVPGVATAGRAGAKGGKAVDTWVVLSIDTNAQPKTVTFTVTSGKNKETKTCEINAATGITVNGAAGKLEDVKAGMRAEITLAEAPGFVLATLKLSNHAAAQAEPVQPKKANKKKDAAKK